MNHSFAFLSGMGVGAGLMYLLDPDMGRRRQALLRDQIVSAAGRTDEGLRTAWRDLRQRTQGFVAETSTIVRHEDVPDQVLTERVRSRMGRYVSHPRAIQVTAHDGCVTLSGLILNHELPGLLACVRSVRGVHDVENRLETHDESEGIAALLGGKKPAGEPLEFMQSNWSPGTRLLAGALGGGLVAFGLTQRFPIACVLGTIGIGLLARAGTNKDFARFLDIGRERDESPRPAREAPRFAGNRSTTATREQAIPVM